MRETCSSGALRRGDQMLATASRVDRWLLVEQPGPWGPPAMPTARMDADVSRRLVAAAQAAKARLLVIRRTLRTVPDQPRRVYLVDSRPGHERQLGAAVSADGDLLTLDLPFHDEPSGRWRTVEDPLLLVCTHGRHDVCCAVRGRPVAAALTVSRPEQTWECSHVGGDRFAANLVVLPYGLYFGQLRPHEAVTIADALATGSVPAGQVRGRSSLSLPAQAAQHYARLELGRERLDDLMPVRQDRMEGGDWRIVLAGSAGPDVEVDVSYDPAGEQGAVLLTCGAEEAKTAPVFRLVGIRPLAHSA